MLGLLSSGQSALNPREHPRLLGTCRGAIAARAGDFWVQCWCHRSQAGLGDWRCTGVPSYAGTQLVPPALQVGTGVFIQFNNGLPRTQPDFPLGVNVYISKLFYCKGGYQATKRARSAERTASCSSAPEGGFLLAALSRRERLV